MVPGRGYFFSVDILLSIEQSHLGKSAFYQRLTSNWQQRNYINKINENLNLIFEIKISQTQALRPSPRSQASDWLVTG